MSDGAVDDVAGACVALRRRVKPISIVRRAWMPHVLCLAYRANAPAVHVTVVLCWSSFFFFQAEDGIRDDLLTGVQTCALPISKVGYLHVRLINPFPSEEILPYLAKAKRRVGIEMNFGAQLAGIVREYTGVEMTHFILKYNGDRKSVV